MVRVVLALCVVTAAISSAQTFKILATFNGSNGANPEGLPAQGMDGQFYGTTTKGGAHLQGVIFEITRHGKLSLLDSFCAAGNCTDGSTPAAGLTFAVAGNFYGTTASGGYGWGTLFKVDPFGNFKTLASFCTATGDCGNSDSPNNAPLAIGRDGNLYGAAQSGGTRGLGVVFQASIHGSLTGIYSFCPADPCTDGANPQGGLIAASDGNFYGTTSAQGLNNAGTVFRITRAGLLTTLYRFCASGICTDGAVPLAGVVEGRDGNLYGTTSAGGANGHGTVYRITRAGALTTIYNFCATAGCPDGAAPMYAALVLGTDQNLYGETTAGGAKGNGTIFRISPAGKLTTLHSFAEGIGPFQPAGLIQATDGDFYGLTPQGGPDNLGTFFRLSMGLGPFIKVVPAAGVVGRRVKILATDLSSGVRGVTFNGTPAQSYSNRNSEVEAFIPAGATSGPIQVLTGAGTLVSNSIFQVLQR